jgi:hypothetical protein
MTFRLKRNITQHFQQNRSILTELALEPTSHFLSFLIVRDDRTYFLKAEPLQGLFIDGRHLHKPVFLIERLCA